MALPFVHGLDNYRKFRSFRKFCNFRSFRNFRWAFLATLWINFVDFVHGLDKYRKFCSFRNCVQSWTLLGVWHLCNLACVYALFWLVFITSYVFMSPSICFQGTKYEDVVHLHSTLTQGPAVINASPLIKPFLTPGGWHERKFVYWKVSRGLKCVRT